MTPHDATFLLSTCLSDEEKESRENSVVLCLYVRPVSVCVDYEFSLGKVVKGK